MLYKSRLNGSARPNRGGGRLKTYIRRKSMRREPREKKSLRTRSWPEKKGRVLGKDDF